MSNSKQKSVVLKAFNKTLSEFLTEMNNIIPNNSDIKSAKRSNSIMSKMNPSLIIKAWETHVNEHYYEHIMKSDLDYFLEKDYSEDMENLGTNDSLEFISNIKEPIKNLDEKNKETAFVYIQNLCKLSYAYNNN